MAGDITLSAPIRSALSSMQTTSAQAAQAQNRLTTGKKINSAIDDPAAFFTSQALTNKANDFKSLLDGMGQAQKTMEAASSGLSGVTKLVNTVKGLVKQAASTTDTALKTSLGKQVDSLMSDIDNLVGDSGYNGTNLVKDDTAKMSVKFSTETTSKLDVAGVDATVAGLGLTKTNNDLSTSTLTDALETKLDAALGTLAGYAASFSTATAIVGNRQDFTKSMVDTLNAGSDALTVADVNEEGAKLLALNTRATISQSALSLASQREQGIARLFG